MTLLELLPGVWTGEGAGHYPTIAPFPYRERLQFTRLGDAAVLEYAQRTWHGETGEPLHRETGYVRVDQRRLELLVVQPTGIAEVHHGHVDQDVVEFGVTTLGRAATALQVETVRRRWSVRADRMIVDLWMTYADVVDGHHLRAELRPTSVSE